MELKDKINNLLKSDISFNEFWSVQSIERMRYKGIRDKTYIEIVNSSTGDVLPIYSVHTVGGLNKADKLKLNTGFPMRIEF